MGWSHRKDHLEQDIETGKICTCSRREDAEKHTICSKLRTTIHMHRKLARRDPQLILLALFLFAVLLGAGVAIATVFVNAHRSEMKSDAIALAEETGNFFKSRLDNAILPLFSLTQFVTEIDSFRTLVQRIGLPGEEGSLPFLPPDDGNTRTHRNVTGVCDDPFLVKKFERIAGSIKRDSKMQRILVNLQLVPNGVVCLVHPINNTEDFPPGIFMDNTGALGHDLLTDPARKVIVAKALPRENVSIVGPVTLRQCDNCDPTVEKAFIARLPILSDTNVISINGVNHMRWGFAAALINWNELVQNSSIYHDFESKGMEFQLTRTDKTPGVKDESTINKNIVILAESAGFHFGFKHQVHAALPTTDNEWAMTVAYCTNGCHAWYFWVILAWTILSINISILVYTIFSQKQFHADAMAAKSSWMVENAERSAQVERELNDFIAHEVRNPLAAALSACSFVSASVQEAEPLVDPSSRTMVREDVQIIETSLNHVNDLLRSMLDLHRAKSDQLMLEWLPTDMRRDILESVATMLYRRDEEFDVIVECPNDLVFSTDRLRLKQIVLNLARNSAKFVEEGFVRLRAETCGADVLVYIEDSGPGIPEDKRGRLFAKFQESLDSLHQGTGIGLSLCQKLVDLMDGSIQLDESYHSGIEGKPGAKFIIRLPYRYMHEVDSRKPGTGEEQKQIHDGGYINETSILEFEEESCTKGSSVEDLPVVRRCQDVELNASSFTSAHEEIKELPEKLDILFVDDDTVLRKLFSRSLKRARPDWSVSEAANGETALYVVEKQAFDIIFIDQYMTSVEKQLLGTETARLLRSKGVKSILCGLSANDMESAFLRAGANAFMMKPFPCKPEPLMEELKRIYNSR